MERLVEYVNEIKEIVQDSQREVNPVIDKSTVEDLALERARVRHRKKYGHSTSKDTLQVIQDNYRVFHSSEFLEISILSDFELVTYEYEDLKSRDVEDDFNPKLYINNYEKVVRQLDEWTAEYGEDFWIINFIDCSDKNELLDEFRDIEITSHFIDEKPDVLLLD